MADIFIDTTNPYKPTLPAKGPLFIGRQDEVRQLVEGLTAPEGESFAVFGGRWFGKTSLLLEVQRQILAQAADPNSRSPLKLKPLPVLITASEYNIKSEQAFFQRVIQAINTQAAAIPDLAELIRDQPLKFVTTDHVDDQIQFMDLVESIGRAALNEHWRLILLIDEAEIIAEEPWSKDLFTHFRGILEGRRGHLLKIVLAGSIDFYSKTSANGSPLIGHVSQVHLHNLSKLETQCLVCAAGGEPLPAEVGNRIYYHSGGHPYVARWLMNRLWPRLINHASVDPALVDRLADRFLVENRPQFNKWQDHIGTDGQKIFGYLIKQHDQSRELAVQARQIKNDLEHKGDIDDLLNTLSYHGFIEGDDGLRYRAAGEIFCQWYRENVDEEPASPLVTVSTLQVLPIALARSNRGLTEQDFPLVKVRVDNRASNCRRTWLRLEVSVNGGYSDPHTEGHEVEPGKPYEFSVLPQLTEKALDIRVVRPAQVAVQVFDVTAGNKPLHQHAYDISLYPPDTAVLMLDLNDKTLPLFDSISAWVTHTHPCLKEVIDRAQHKLTSPYHKGYSQNVIRLREQARAIYAALQDCKLAYDESTYTLKKIVSGGSVREMSQRVRLPRESLSDNKINCLDGAVLFSSLLLAFNIQPVILLVAFPDYHAVTGWKLTPNAPVDDQRQLEFVDASQFSQSFEQAQSSAAALYHRALNDGLLTHSPDDLTGYATLIDVVSSFERRGYHPLE